MFNFTNYCDAGAAALPLENNDSDNSSSAIPAGQSTVAPEECTSFFMSSTAANIVLTSGTISTVSSIIILYVIFVSPKQFKTVYHRIMGSLAFFDAISSFAIALNNVPMPQDTIYPFEGHLDGRLRGSVSSCEIQGLTYAFGYLGSYFTFMGLMIFYASIIQFKISDAMMKRYLEPLIQGVAWILPFGLTLFFFTSDIINPTPIEPWCSIEFYPFDCDHSIDKPCIRGKPNFNMKAWNMAVISFIVIGAVNVITCMSLIICGTWTRGSSFMRRELSRQAYAYIICFILSYSSRVLSLLSQGYRPSVGIFACTLFPLQGFFNMIIFIRQKIQAIQTIHRTAHVVAVTAERESINNFQPMMRMTFLEAMKVLFLKPRQTQHLHDTGLSHLTISSLGDDTSDVDLGLVACDPAYEEAKMNEEGDAMASDNVGAGNDIGDLNAMARDNIGSGNDTGGDLNPSLEDITDETAYMFVP